MPTNKYQRNTHYVSTFPSQKKTTAQKGDQFFIDSIDALESIIFYDDDTIRQSQYNKQINYDLANDILNDDDMEKMFNPTRIKDAFIPAKSQNYPIANPKMDLLLGEEWKRRFEWRIVAKDDDAISSREDAKKQALMDLAMKFIEDEAQTEEELQRKIQDLEKYSNYEYQDLKEIVGTRILSYLYREQNLKYKFNRGFHDLLISSEEIYRTDIVNGNPTVTKCDPRQIFTLRTGESNYIEDCDAILEVNYLPIGQIIDEFYDELTDDDITYLESENREQGNGKLNHRTFTAQMSIDDFRGELVDTNIRNNQDFGAWYNEQGEVRVLRARWKSMRKIGKLTYIDDDGNEQEDIVSEYYKPDKAAGESVKWIWVSEWLEATKIGEDIYVHMKPREIQFRNMSDLSKCRPGYTGTVSNINNTRGMSLMDRMKPYQYMYNIVMRRTELAFAKYKGPIMRMNLAEIPEGWDIDKWMYYAEIMNWAVYDPFKEGAKGAAQGKMAGSLNQNSMVMNSDMGNYIQQNILMLQYIETQLGEIAGVTKQRQGQIENRETVGGVERAVSQSSFITEKWFILHDDVRLRVLSDLLETAKYAYKDNKNQKIQYILDDMGIQVLNFDGQQFNETDYGLMLSNASRDTEIFQSLQQLAHAAIQNDKMDFSMLMEIMNSESISHIRRSIEKTEQEKEQQRQTELQEQNQATVQVNQDNLQAAAADNEADREVKREEIQAKLDIAELNALKGEEGNSDDIKDKLADMKLKMEDNFKKKQLNETIRHNKVTEKQKDAEIVVKKIQKAASKTSK